MPVIFDVSSSNDEIKNGIKFASKFMNTMVIDNKKDNKYNDIILLKNDNFIKYKNYIYTYDYENKNVSGYIIDDYSILNIKKVKDNLKNKRENYDVLLYINEFKNTGDIAKYIALGSDAVILSSKIFEYGLSDTTDIKEKALNFLISIRKELSLLCGPWEYQICRAH